MTWALWGEARAKSADDLIYYGQTEMEVDFEFEMGAERYRVIRKYSRPRSRTGSGQTVLELQVAHDGQFRPITANTVRETERKISELLRLDYETFINSACLLQGRADEFTVKRPGERKRVLAEILGLSYYDRLEERAREALRDWQRAIVGLETELSEIDREVANRPALIAEEEQVAAELERAELQERTASAELQAAQGTRRERDLERQRLTDTENRLGGLNAELARLQLEAKRSTSKIDTYESVIVRAADIEAAYRELLEVRRRLDELNAQQAEDQRLREKQQKQLHAIELARTRLEGQIRADRETITKLVPLVEQFPALQDRQFALVATLAGLDQAEQDLAARRTEQVRLIEQRQAHQMAKECLRGEMEELRRKVDLLTAGDGRCWLCGHELGVAGQQHLRDVCERDGLERKRLYRDHEAAAKELDGRLKALEAEIDQQQKQLAKRRSAAQAEAGKVAEQLARCAEAQEALERTQAQESAAQRILETGAFAPEARAQVAEIETRLAALAYSAETHEAVRARQAALAEAERDHWTLEQARREIEPERAALAGTLAAIADRRLQVTSEEATLREVRDRLATYPDLDALIAQREAELGAIRRIVAETRERLGGIRQQIQAANTLAARRPAKEQELKDARLEKTIHDDLVTAFGKRGIQAMIIDAALPEIEEEANQLLARMTDNRLHLAFETQRESRKGSAIETLDIKVADELGTRPYELFSGGEAFRINFAVRIALSRLLTRRAGARLQTLIIDEGFGTQDAGGREKMVDAINSIGSDFEKILVITHVDELKDLFTARIDVVKGETGSIATVA